MKRRHQRFERALVRHRRKLSHRRYINVHLRMDFTRFNEQLRTASEATNRFAAAMEAAMPECAADGCTRRATGGYVIGLPGKRCPWHVFTGYQRRPRLPLIR